MKRRDPEDWRGNHDHFSRYCDTRVTTPDGLSGVVVGYAIIAAEADFGRVPDMRPRSSGPRWRVRLDDGISQWWPPHDLTRAKGGVS